MTAIMPPSPPPFRSKNSYFPLSPGATGSLQITPSGSGDENESFQGRSFPK